MAKRQEHQEAEAEKARRDLDRMHQQSEKILGANTPSSAKPGEPGYDPSTDPNDPIEIWGKRIGRSLGYLFAIYLIYYLATTYVFK